MEKTEKAFRWIVGILREEKIPFQLTGGFAARLYGATRELKDIDIDIADRDFERIIPRLQGYITFGPERFRDAHSDLLNVLLEYEGQKIDVGGADSSLIYSAQSQKWEPMPADLNKAIQMEAHGLNVPVISRENLIRNKERLQRPEDEEDLKSLR